jgi:hypothetical protein
MHMIWGILVWNAKIEQHEGPSKQSSKSILSPSGAKSMISQHYVPETVIYNKTGSSLEPAHQKSMRFGGYHASFRETKFGLLFGFSILNEKCGW